MMKSTSSSFWIILAAILLVGNHQLGGVTALTSLHARPFRLGLKGLQNVLGYGRNLKMISEVAVLPEAPKADAIEAFPNKVTKEFSSSRVSSINLLKNCLGAGVFSLNARVSAISTNPTTILPASLLVLTMALWATYNFYMVSIL